MSDDDFDDVVEDLELTAEESTLAGEPPERAGIECRWCGLGVEVPWDQRRELPERMRAHLTRCPRA